MATTNLSAYNESDIPSAENMSFGIVVAEWNAHITHTLYEGCIETLVKHGADEDEIYTAHVPGSFELVAGAQMIANFHQVDAVICLGCVIKGETEHDIYINQAVAKGLMDLTLKFDMPFIFGLLTVNNEAQAQDRAGGKHGNKGVEAAVTAIRMVALEGEMEYEDE
jgi:6,7-dimethyl-8-ribityllumazine synthase